VTTKKLQFAKINPQGVIFDMDGTLLDSLTAWKNLADNFLIKNNLTQTTELIKQIEKLTLEKVAHLFAEKFALNLTGDEIFSQWQEEMTYQYLHKITSKPGVKEFLQELAERKIKCCVATLTDKHLAEMALDNLGLLQYMQFVITVGEVGKPKSDPQIYLEAAAKMQLDKKNCLVFEDALYAIISAKQAGFAVCGILDEQTIDHPDIIKENCDIAIESFTELL
jgi:HAD superfamily hydrolase (TIGR01509 family)